MPMFIDSPAFDVGQSIPVQYTCEGVDTSPPLRWGGVPGEARSLVLIVDDPDAPDPEAPRVTWVHWVLYNLPPASSGVEAGAAALPAGTMEGSNGWSRTGYGGPCPPIGRHRYFFKLYALDETLPDLHRPSKASVEQAMYGHVIERAELIGTYRKGGR